MWLKVKHEANVARNPMIIISTTCLTTGRELVLEMASEEEINELSRMDGCYVMKTDLPKEIADKETVHKDIKTWHW